MAANQRRSGGGFTGHPAIIFWLMMDFGRDTQSLKGNLQILDKWLYQLDACTQFTTGLADDFKTDLTVIETWIGDCWDVYDPIMEADGFVANEKDLIVRMRRIYKNLALKTAEAHVCDGIEFGDVVERMG
jgi:hypothetical protein